MNDITHKLKLLTKYLNRYFRRDNNIVDWSYEYKYDGIVIYIDYDKDKHIASELTIHVFKDIPREDMIDFSKSIYQNFRAQYEHEIILGDDL